MRRQNLPDDGLTLFTNAWNVLRQLMVIAYSFGDTNVDSG